MVKALECKACGGQMVKTSQGNCLGLCLGLILVLVGVVLFLSIPLVGWVLGPIVGLVGLMMGGKKVWRCKTCGNYFNRA